MMVASRSHLRFVLECLTPPPLCPQVAAADTMTMVSRGGGQ